MGRHEDSNESCRCQVIEAGNIHSPRVAGWQPESRRLGDLSLNTPSMFNSMFAKLSEGRDI